jgi:hypothetical protein
LISKNQTWAGIFRSLEEVIILTLREYGLQGERSREKQVFG